MKEKQRQKEKILIIKPGYSEILDGPNNSRRVSLGDVLRTTVILNLFKEDDVTWVATEESRPLIEGNKYISRILPYDFTTAEQLKSEEFDRVINLETIPGICALADKIRARRSRYGFTFNTQTGEAQSLDNASELLKVGSNHELKRNNKRTVQELLFEMLGKKWNGEEYTLGYKPKSAKEYDVGLNTQVGSKWPTKAWPKEYWDKLEAKLNEEKLKVTRQDKQGEKVTKNLYGYMDWINSCKFLVTNDSLGLHLSLALGVETLGLFGPTPHSEIYFYGRGMAVTPIGDKDCRPCMKNTESCPKYKDKTCMHKIPVIEVFSVILSYFNQ